MGVKRRPKPKKAKRRQPAKVKRGIIQGDGSIAYTSMPVEWVAACPLKIVRALHFKKDGACRCKDPFHTSMKAWGYEWNEKKKRWM